MKARESFVINDSHMMIRFELIRTHGIFPGCSLCQCRCVCKRLWGQQPKPALQRLRQECDRFTAAGLAVLSPDAGIAGQAGSSACSFCLSMNFFLVHWQLQHDKRRPRNVGHGLMNSNLMKQNELILNLRRHAVQVATGTGSDEIRQTPTRTTRTTRDPLPHPTQFRLVPKRALRSAPRLPAHALKVISRSFIFYYTAVNW